MFQIATYNEYNVTIVEYGSDAYSTVARMSDKTSPEYAFQSLSNSQWSKTYNNKFVSDHGDLILAIDRIAFPTGGLRSIANLSFYLPISLEKGNQEIIGRLTTGSSDWIQYQYPPTPQTVNIVSMSVGQAFAKVISPQSRIQISLYFMITVIVFNLLKLVIMLWVLFTDKHEYIVTQGDALATFLQRPDMTTRGKCTYGKDEMLYHLGRAPYILNREEKMIEDRFSDRLAGKWLPRERLYFDSITHDRQIFFALL